MLRKKLKIYFTLNQSIIAINLSVFQDIQMSQYFGFYYSF